MHSPPGESTGPAGLIVDDKAIKTRTDNAAVGDDRDAVGPKVSHGGSMLYIHVADCFQHDRKYVNKVDQEFFASTHFQAVCSHAGASGIYHLIIPACSTWSTTKQFATARVPRTPLYPTHRRYEILFI